jgi:hypothetical protein
MMGDIASGSAPEAGDGEIAPPETRNTERMKDRRWAEASISDSLTKSMITDRTGTASIGHAGIRAILGSRERPQPDEKWENFGETAVGSASDVPKICYTCQFGAVPKWPKGEVCKTSIRGFESHPRLQ